MQPIKNIAISIYDMNKIKKGCLAKGIVLLSIAIVGSILGVKACSDNNIEEGLDKGKEEMVKEEATVDTALVSRLADFASKQRPEGKFAFHVYDITADKSVYGCNDTLALPSASVMRLRSGGSGLKLVGTDYHYWTGICMRGTVGNEGKLEGDVAFRAGLDPQLMAPDLNIFAKAIRQKGVKIIVGKLLVDLHITEPVKRE